MLISKENHGEADIQEDLRARRASVIYVQADHRDDSAQTLRIDWHPRRRFTFHHSTLTMSIFYVT